MRRRLDSRSFLQQLCELELLDREQRATERRIKAAKFPVTKSLDTFAVEPGAWRAVSLSTAAKTCWRG